MVDVEGDTASEVIDKSIDFVLREGEERSVWGGTIPENIGGDGPNDFDREMVEYTDGFSYVLRNPLQNWSEISRHWTGITLRETEDDLWGNNPGYVADYSRVYREWLEYDESGESVFPHTYGERLVDYGATPTDDKNPGCENYTETVDQWDRVRELLREHPTTRKAMMVIADPHVDTVRMRDPDNAYVPCNLTLQWRVVDQELNLHVHSRSKDILRGSTENLFEFPLLQQLMAGQLGVDVGKYVETIDNIHLYRDQIEDGYLDLPIDPYEYLEPQKPRQSFPVWFGEVDSMMIPRSDPPEEILDFIRSKSCPDDFWVGWKSALCLEWYRMRGKSWSEVSGFWKMVRESRVPWMTSVAKRSWREWERDEILDPFPDNVRQEITEWS